jgi:hypothetical protein
VVKLGVESGVFFGVEFGVIFGVDFGVIFGVDFGVIFGVDFKFNIVFKPLPRYEYTLFEIPTPT